MVRLSAPPTETLAAARQQTSEHAVVLGASMAGLLAARVLADVYRTVTVIDRDVLPELGAPRRGVPQGRHIHILHPRGREVLDELFPGFTTDVIHAGAELADALGGVRGVLSGHRLRQADIGRSMLFASRPFLEGQVRARVQALPGVTFRQRTDIVGLTTTADRRRVTGVRCCGTGQGVAGEPPSAEPTIPPPSAEPTIPPPSAEPTIQPQTIAADLVVDATGRGSRTPVWLPEWGYQRPVQDRVDIGLGYATRTYRLRPGVLGSDKAMLIAATPDNPRFAAVSALEGGRHAVTLGGILGDYPPTDPAGFDAFAASLAFTDVVDAIAGAQPLDDPVAFRFPASVRHRYERLRHFPKGLLVLGDAVCSFNPIYGQGMTVAANQAVALRRVLARSPDPAPSDYFRTIAKTIDSPWDVAVGADLGFPEVPGTRTVKIRLVNAYLSRLHAAAVYDVILSAAFARVVGLLEAPETLLRPDRLLRVWWTNRRHPPGRAATATPTAHARP
jgi:2-polyprenyl-6-methoxyphenol hydroxylase-like FAD-dependent oxidoreductase